MSAVRVLDRNLANMIAAGEVVERPANVVKELVENALDAGADQIVIEIKNGGKTFIRVTDNGKGMNASDARTSFLRHATSKISEPADLFCIRTMGFRGEALAAISSVSRTEMITSTSDDTFGTHIIMEAGTELCFEEIGAPRGTTIIVQNLFFNTPARLNFMKKDSTETAAIVSLVQKFAIKSNSVSFKLIVDDKTSLQTSNCCDRLDVIYSVYGKEITEHLVPVINEKYKYSISGYVSLPRYSRANRNYQLVYVNGRIVKSKTVNAAIDRAYKNLLMNGKHPVAVLDIIVPLEKVDVNVHPTKMEVKFSDEQLIFELVYYAIKNSLEQENTIKNFFDSASSTREVEHISVNTDSNEKDIASEKDSNDVLSTKEETKDGVTVTPKNVVINPFKSDFSPIKSVPVSSYFVENPNVNDTETVNEQSQLDFSDFSSKYVVKSDDIDLLSPELPVKFVGELFKTYIIIECGKSFFLIDKHAAHERILFNKIYEQYETSEKYTETLLTPIPVTLSPEELVFVNEHKDTFNKLGYVFDEFGKTDILLRALPYVLKVGDAIPAFMELIDILSENENETVTEIENRNIRMLACKAAIKAGYDTSEQEMKDFVKKLVNSPNTNYCPHGRPIFVEYTKDAIEKAFKRIV